MSDADISADDDVVVDRALAEELERFCASDGLSLEGLRRRIAGVPFDDLHNSSFFHRLCLNKKVTMEMVECILERFPSAASVETDHFYDREYQYLVGRTTAYPLHCACANESCPDAVLKLLMQKSPTSLGHLSVILTDLDDDFQGLDCGEYEADVSAGTPLHYYLARRDNVDLGFVKMFANACQEALRISCSRSGYTCLHTLLCNPNIRDLYDALVFIAESAPSALESISGYDEVPLHVACTNCHADPRTVEYLLNMRPEFIRRPNICGELPLHKLCCNKELEESVGLEIYNLLIEKDPGLPRVQDFDGHLPLHQAVCGKSLELCKLLARAYPESLWVTAEGNSPIHEACREGCLDTVEYLLEQCPESIGARNREGHLPLHEAAYWDGDQKAEIIEFLLSQDPAGAERTTADANQRLPLHLACESSTKKLRSFQVLYDFNPWAIAALDGEGKTPIDLARAPVQYIREEGPLRASIVRFLNAQLDNFRKAQDVTAMTTLDDNGWLPLHHALSDNAPLGAVKLLVKGNPAALHVPVGKLSFPLHLACQFSTTAVVKYLVELESSYLNRCDFGHNTPIHYACRGGKCETVKYLLGRRVASVSERNDDDKLPIHLLCEAGEDKVDDCESPVYVETIWRLLLAHPEACRVEEEMHSGNT